MFLLVGTLSINCSHVAQSGTARHRCSRRTTRSPCALALVELVAGRHGQPGDRNALVEELVVLLVGGLAADGARRSLLVEDLARFLRKLLAHVLGLGQQL